jgi:hypothetical protein
MTTIFILGLLYRDYLHATEFMAGNVNETASRFGRLTYVEIGVTNSPNF